jgi:hypothetical protein
MVNGDNRGERLQIMLSGNELTILDDFRFRKRMPSRAAAIRELLKRGLAAEGFEAAAFGTKSEEFGVTGKTPPGRRQK